jgi:hypothetical protein
MLPAGFAQSSPPQASPPHPSTVRRGAVRHSLARGSTLDADHPKTGVKIARRLTRSRTESPSAEHPSGREAGGCSAIWRRRRALAASWLGVGVPVLAVVSCYRQRTRKRRPLPISASARRSRPSGGVQHGGRGAVSLLVGPPRWRGAVRAPPRPGGHPRPADCQGAREVGRAPPLS